MWVQSGDGSGGNADGDDAAVTATERTPALPPRPQRVRQAADLLRQQITTGAFPDGALPDERTLGVRLGASRNAVREALGLLRAEGLITRRPGVGTTVARPKYGHGLDRLAGLAETLVGHGTITNQVRAAYFDPAPPPAIRQRLELPDGHGAVHVERLRFLDGEPLSLDATYLVADIGELLLDRDLAGSDIFALIEQVTGRRLGSAEVAVHAVNSSAPTATLLGIEPGDAVFAIERLVRLVDGRPIDVESIHVRADRLTLRTTVHRAPPG